MADLTQTVPFTFKELYTDIKQRFADKGYDVAEGSHTMMLADIMAYMITMLNVNTALNINETILGYAQKRDNVLEDARTIGYESTKATSYIYSVTVVTPEYDPEQFPNGGTIIIPKYTEFTAGDKTYYYTGEQIILKNLFEPETLTLRVKEGTLHRYTDDADALQVTIDTVYDNGKYVDQYYIDIPYTNIEDDGIRVYCSYFDDFGVFYDKVEYTKSDKTMFDVDDDLDFKFIRLDNIDYGTCRIYFKYAGIGKGLKKGTVVYIDILETSGKDGEIADTANTEALTPDINDLTVTGIDLVQKGNEAETIEEIKQNAPKYYNSSNRLVTASDYISACTRDARVKKAVVWGGCDEFPQAPGHIWFSFLTSNSKREFTHDDAYTLWTRNTSDNVFDYSDDSDTQKQACSDYYNENYVLDTEIRSVTYDRNGNIVNPGIWDKIKNLGIPTLIYHHRHPIICLFSYDIEILKYHISENKTDIHSEIFDIIDHSFSGESSTLMLEDFSVEYFNSSIIKRIDERVTDISGFNLYLKNQLILNTKTTCCENLDSDNRDIYIPLATPYESYFDDGFLNIDALPNIDTENFYTYGDEVGGDIYTDWSAIKADIAQGEKQQHHKLIVAPVKVKMKCTSTLDPVSRTVKLSFKVQKDSFAQEEATYTNTVVYYLKDGEEVVIPHDYDTGWYLDVESDDSVIHFGLSCDVQEFTQVTVKADQFCGFYYLFNSYKKEILVHLFVDAKVQGYALYARSVQASDNYALYTQDEQYLFSNTEYYLQTEESYTEDTKYVETLDTTPKSYLYTNDKMYMNSADAMYLTTRGYSADDPNAVTPYSGDVVHDINVVMYRATPLKADFFYRNRYLDLRYRTGNFKLRQNVIPHLKRVEFLDVLD